MDDFDYVLQLIDPWIDQYIELGVDALTSTEIVGVGVWLLQAQVKNGGFDQYYFNSPGDLAVPTVDALRLIGATRTADMLAEANSAFPNSLPPTDRSLRQKALDEIDAPARFSALEAEFYQGSEDLVALLARHYRKTMQGSGNTGNNVA